MLKYTKNGGILMVKELDFHVKTCASRRELRDKVISKFMEDEPGEGGGDKASKYRYNVELLKDGKRIYLTRPAHLKKGFDFRINVENMVFMTKHEYPKHDDIFDDLRKKRQENPSNYKKLHEAIERVFSCEDPEDILPDYSNIEFSQGYSIEMILKVIKWLLIEQDIRDWNYSGRYIFKTGVDEILGD
jgi:hypothetical protein